MALLFYPDRGAPSDAKPHPRTGTTCVDKATGRFDFVTSHKGGDGLVRGKHKVTLVTPVLGPCPLIVPPEYSDPPQTRWKSTRPSSRST